MMNAAGGHENDVGSAHNVPEVVHNPALVGALILQLLRPVHGAVHDGNLLESAAREVVDEKAGHLAGAHCESVHPERAS